MSRLRTAAKIALPVLALAIGAGGAGYLRATKPHVEPQPVTEKSFAVETVAADFATHQPALDLFGELVSTREAVLQAPVGGRVIEMSPKLVEGGRIAAGELLLRIDPFDYDARLRELEAQRTELDAAISELEILLEGERDLLALTDERITLATRDLERQRQLQTSSFASQKNLDDASMAVTAEKTIARQSQREVDALASRIEQKRAALDRLEVDIDRARHDLEDTMVLAPFDALISEVTAVFGKELRAFDTIAMLVDSNAIEMRFSLRDGDFGRLWRDGLIGRPVSAVWRLGQHGFPLEGEVVRADTWIDATAGGVGVYAKITENPDDAPLRPGAFLEIRLPDRRYDDVVALPASALFNGDTVYAVDEERLVARPIDVVDSRGGTVLVRGDLVDGERVVTSRLAEIAPGLKVTSVP